jgi:hypothetical protein
VHLSPRRPWTWPLGAGAAHGNHREFQSGTPGQSLHLKLRVIVSPVKGSQITTPSVLAPDALGRIPDRKWHGYFEIKNQ